MENNDFETLLAQRLINIQNLLGEYHKGFNEALMLVIKATNKHEDCCQKKHPCGFTPGWRQKDNH